MPLLRQTLYSQNVNLYLAPTADGRDAWLSLMRTVGVEGRCFVVSSNMCVPGKDASSSGSGGVGVGTERKPPGLPVRESVSESVISEEDGIGAAPVFNKASHRKRRKSVFDDDGNEIVLCCPEDDATASTPHETNGTKTTGAVHGKVSSWESRGGSCIINPFGDVLAGPQWEDPDGLIYADVDLRDCVRGRLDFDAAGSYSRNDSFKFSVNGLDLEPLPY